MMCDVCRYDFAGGTKANGEVAFHRRSTLWGLTTSGAIADVLFFISLVHSQQLWVCLTGSIS